MTDYIFHVANRHPFIGVFTCHPLHTYTKFERFCVEWLRCVATVALVVKMKNTQQWEHVFTGGANPFMDFAGLFSHVTLPMMIMQHTLAFLSSESGRPNGCLQKHLGHRCLCLFQWTVMAFCFSLVCSATALAHKIIYEPGWWNEYGKDTKDLEKCYSLAWWSLAQGWLVWFILDNILPHKWTRCPLEFGFYTTWTRELSESHDLNLHGDSERSSSYSGSESDEGKPFKSWW